MKLYCAAQHVHRSVYRRLLVICEKEHAELDADTAFVIRPICCFRQTLHIPPERAEFRIDAQSILLKVIAFCLGAEHEINDAVENLKERYIRRCPCLSRK